MKQNSYLLSKYQRTLTPALFLTITGAFAASVLGELPLLFWIGWLIAGLFALLLVFVFSWRYHSSKWFLWLAFFFLGGAWFSLFHFQPSPSDISLWAGRSDVIVDGTVVGLGKSEKQWIVEVNSLNSQKASGRALIKIPKALSLSEPLHIGRNVQITGRIRLPERASFPGGFDYRSYLLQHKITAMLTAEQCSIKDKDSSSLWLKTLNLADNIRNRINSHFRENLPSPESEILASIVLGERAVGLDRSIKQQFIDAGLIHILAASGLNVGLIGVFFLLVGKVARLPLRATLLLAMLGIAFYSLMAGLSPSVERAAMMFELGLLLKLIDRELAPVVLLCLAGVILTLINPMIVTMLGFQLSFLSAFGLMAMVKPLEEKLGFYLTEWVSGLILVPLIAQLWVAPIILFHFNQVQLMSIPANLVALPIVAALTYLGFILGGISLILPSFTGWLIEHLWFLSAGLKGIASFFGGLPFATATFSSPPATTVVLILGGVMLWAYRLNFPDMLSLKRLVTALSIILLLAIIPASLAKWQDQYQFSVTWLSDEDETYAQIIKTPSGKVIVNSSNLNYYMGRDLANYLKKKGLTHIDLFNVAYPKIGSLDGFEYLIDKVSIERVAFPGDIANKELQKILLQHIKEDNISVLPMFPTNIVKGKDFEALFFSAPPSETVQRFDFGSVCMVTHWSSSPLEDSSMKLMTEGCEIIQDNIYKGNATARFGKDSIPVLLKPFKSFIIKEDKIRVSGY